MEPLPVPVFGYDGDELEVRWGASMSRARNNPKGCSSSFSLKVPQPQISPPFRRFHLHRINEQKHSPKPFHFNGKRLQTISAVTAKANARALSMKIHRQSLREMERSKNDSPHTITTSFSPDSSVVYSDDLSVNSCNSPGGTSLEYDNTHFNNHQGMQHVHILKCHKDDDTISSPTVGKSLSSVKKCKKKCGNIRSLD